MMSAKTRTSRRKDISVAFESQSYNIVGKQMDEGRFAESLSGKVKISGATMRGLIILLHCSKKLALEDGRADFRNWPSASVKQQMLLEGVAPTH
jgi:hypothetical protein